MTYPTPHLTSFRFRKSSQNLITQINGICFLHRGTARAVKNRLAFCANAATPSNKIGRMKLSDVINRFARLCGEKIPPSLSHLTGIIVFARARDFILL